jgi:hypothetical protein
MAKDRRSAPNLLVGHRGREWAGRTGDGWYYYLDDKIQFPFQARCIAAKVVSPLHKGEIVQVQGMAPQDACSGEMLVLIRRQGRTLAVPLAQLTRIGVDESTAETIADGHYWVAQDYCF